ncbi:MAG: helix-hairpin-helix domain-containing protein [Mycobacteriales bacterium]
MRRRVPAEQQEWTALRLAALAPAGWVPPAELGAVASEPEPGWREPEPESLSESLSDRSWAPSALDPDEPGVPPWSSRVQLLRSRPAAIGLVGVAVLAALLSGFTLLRSRPVPVAIPVVERAGQSIGASAEPATAEVVVSVVGKVRRPGLVRLALGARVDDAVRAAGGATAGLGLLNVARKVVDGEQILVGIDPPPGSAAGGSASTGNGRLDLNSAGVAEFDGLPGIGPVLAQRIVDWRTEHGRFASVDQLREVPGIGESKFQAIKSKVAV